MGLGTAEIVALAEALGASMCAPKETAIDTCVSGSGGQRSSTIDDCLLSAGMACSVRSVAVDMQVPASPHRLVQVSLWGPLRNVWVRIFEPRRCLPQRPLVGPKRAGEQWDPVLKVALLAAEAAKAAGRLGVDATTRTRAGSAVTHAYKIAVRTMMRELAGVYATDLTAKEVSAYGDVPRLKWVNAHQRDQRRKAWAPTPEEKELRCLRLLEQRLQGHRRLSAKGP